MTAQVYHCLDANRDPIYIGSTVDWRKREAAHRRGSPWWGDVVLVRLTDCESKEDARAKERREIMIYRPIHNVSCARTTRHLEELFDAVGRAAFCQRARIRAAAISAACRNGVLPASWYMALCDLSGRSLPVEWFTFKGIE